MLGKFKGLSDIDWKLFEDIFPISPQKRGKRVPHIAVEAKIRT